MPLRAAIFDLDGTLLDTLDDLADAMNTSLRRLGFPEHPVESYRFFVGAGLVNLACRALPDGTPEDVAVTVTSTMKEVYATN